MAASLDRYSSPTGAPASRYRTPTSTPPAGGPGCPYRRAAELFAAASGGASLHLLRHSALAHVAQAGPNTVTLLAYSGHTSAASLARYARVSPRKDAK